MLIAHEYDAFRQATGRRECYMATVGVTQGGTRPRHRLRADPPLMAAAQADGCDVATLYADADSPTGALTLYEHIGFTKQRTSVTLIKDLTASNDSTVDQLAARLPAGPAAEAMMAICFLPYVR